MSLPGLNLEVFSGMGRGNSQKAGFWRRTEVSKYSVEGVYSDKSHYQQPPCPGLGKKRILFALAVHLAAGKRLEGHKKGFSGSAEEHVCAHHKGCPDLQLFPSAGNPGV